jgi:WD40 repeat protein
MYQTNLPVQSYTIPLSSAPASSEKSPAQTHTLSVAELGDRSEFSRINTEFLPLGAQFIPGRHEVFFAEPKPNATGLLYKTWQLSSGKVKKCMETKETDLPAASFLDEHRLILALPQEKTGDLLAELRLPECTRTIIDSVDPDDKNDRSWGRFAISRDARSIAYKLYGGHRAILWDIDKKQVSKRLAADPLFFSGELVYTSDGKLLVAVAKSNPFVDEGNDTLLFFDTKTYQLVRRLSFPDIAEFAISPNGRILAVGYTKETSRSEQAFVVLYDVRSGNELGRVSHPPVNKPRSDPFAARISRIFFTPDGRYLLSTTSNTRVWQITNFK